MKARAAFACQARRSQAGGRKATTYPSAATSATSWATARRRPGQATERPGAGGEDGARERGRGEGRHAQARP